MYPGFHGWWQKRAQHCAERAHQHHEGHHHGHDGGYQAQGLHEGGGGLGVRRPLRFLAQRLELDEVQVAELARILNALKTERAQAAVDEQRTLTSFAEAIEKEAFDAASAARAGELRVTTAQRLREAVLKALGELHALLRPEQRKELAYLLRTGTLTV